jgi:hypothetical protein
MILQLSFLPDNEDAPVVKATYPVVKMIDGHPCFLVFGSAAAGTPEWRREPELEALLKPALLAA